MPDTVASAAAAVPLFGFVAILLLVELVILGAWRAGTGGGLTMRQLVPMLGAGFALAVAAVLSHLELPPAATGMALLAALAAHLADLASRWRPSGRPFGSRSAAPVHNAREDCH